MKPRGIDGLILSIQSRKEIEAYISVNRKAYIKAATNITPDVGLPRDVWGRISFSILSANTPFETSIKGLDYAYGCYDTGKDLDGLALTTLGAMVPCKADFINSLPRNRRIIKLTKGINEPWGAYRLRLRDSVKGLGLVKASFAASLLYPLESDVACVDTWIQKVFLGFTGFKTIGVKAYLAIEEQIRQIAHDAKVNTFLGQWSIWDHKRGGVVNEHDIFPSSHKEAV